MDMKVLCTADAPYFSYVDRGQGVSGEESTDVKSGLGMWFCWESMYQSHLTLIIQFGL